MRSDAPYCVLAGLFSRPAPFLKHPLPNGKFTQIMKTAHRAPPAERVMYMPRTESKRFTRFSENDSFGKPGFCGEIGVSDHPLA